MCKAGAGSFWRLLRMDDTATVIDFVVPVSVLGAVGKQLSAHTVEQHRPVMLQSLRPPLLHTIQLHQRCASQVRGGHYAAYAPSRQGGALSGMHVARQSARDLKWASHPDGHPGDGLSLHYDRPAASGARCGVHHRPVKLKLRPAPQELLCRLKVVLPIADLQQHVQIKLLRTC